MNVSDDIPNIVYIQSCPNCGSNITSLRLVQGLTCENCLADGKIKINELSELIGILEEQNKIRLLQNEKNILNEEKNVVQLFRKVVGTGPIGPQRSWIIRALRGESFAIVAPPGLGKTTFGIVMSLYFASKSQKSLMMFPTKTLVSQVVQKIQEMSKLLDQPPRVLYYSSGITRSKKAEFNKSLNERDFDVLISTSRYVMENLDELNKIKYRYLFIDDVDAVLKSSKSSITILKLMGFNDDNIGKARELLRLSRDDKSSFEEIRKIRKKFMGERITIFSSATITKSNPVFTSLVGFKPGSATIYLRNVIDSFVVEENPVIQVNQIVNKLGPGGLIFVPIDRGLKYAHEIEKGIEGLNVSVLSSNSTKKLEEFENGSLDILIGVATHYGLLVRGIDIPWRVRYTLFAGIPKFRFKLGETMHPLAMLRILTILSVILKDPNVTNTLKIVKYKLRKISTAALAMLAKSVKEGDLEDRNLIKAYEIVNYYLKQKNVIEQISRFGDVSVNGDYISMPDYLTYIQASGRASRLYGGHLTTGLSVLLVDDTTLFELLKKRLSFILENLSWSPFDIENETVGGIGLKDIIKKIDSERSEIMRKREMGTISQSLGRIKSVLLIVESPNKAKTISNFFSRPSIREFEGLRVYETVMGDKILMITASEGHVYDLTTKEIGIYGVEVHSGGDSHIDAIPFYNTIKKCENGHQFTEYGEGCICPICGSKNIRDKQRSISALRELAMEVDEVLIGSDPDVEGEKIAWDLYLNLRPFNNRIYRAEFHEITRRAITESINSPRNFSVPMLRSQLVRRIEDRWIGFKLTSKLKEEFWRKYCTEFTSRNDCEAGNRNLSAGRVQTPVLGWIKNRYEEYKSTKKKVYVARFNGFSVLVPVQPGIRKNTKVKIIIEDLQRKQETIGPFPAYTTDTYLADASTFYLIPTQESMRVAQDLFESGLITYHRTDSTRISNVGINVAETFLKDMIGEKYKEIFVPRSWGEGGAHEAIRPTRPLNAEQLRVMIEQGEIEPSKRLTFNHYRLYDMIFRRFLSSQLVPLVVEKEVVKISCKKGETTLSLDSNVVEQVVKVSLQKDVGLPSDNLYIPFRSVSTSLDKVVRGTLPFELEATLTNSFIKSNSLLFTQGELVSEMKNKGIGRPSTYSSIISTLLRRGYVFESMKSKRLIPTRLGEEVYKFLSYKYGKFVSEDRTKDLLKRMDDIEEGKGDYRQVLKELYNEIKGIR